MNALTTKAPSRTSLEPSTLQEAISFSQMLARSTMVPRDFQGKPENILVAIQWGREIGLAPLQALQNIAVIGGRPSVWGDAMLALVRGSGVCAFVRETVEGNDDEMVAICSAARRGEENDTTTVRFTVADAKKAGLWGKQGPWIQYPKRMLQMRARGFALRDLFPDVLRGVVLAEEAQDMPEQQPFAGQTIEARAEPPASTGAQNRRDQINEEVPIYPAPKRTLATAIDELALAFGLAATREAVDEVLASDACQKTLDFARNGAKERLEGIIKAALDRTAETPKRSSRSAEGEDADRYEAAEAAKVASTDPDEGVANDWRQKIADCTDAGEVYALHRNPVLVRWLKDWEKKRPELFKSVDDAISMRLLDLTPVPGVSP